MTTCEVLKLKLVTSNDAKAVRNFVREFFSENEPLQQHLLRKECKDFRYFHKALSVGNCINEGLSYVYTTETGEIVALGLVEYRDTNSDPNEFITPIISKLSPFFDMIEENVKPMIKLTETDKEAHFRMLVVHSDWIGNGLAKLLVEKVMASLKSLGFTHIKVYCTSAYSTKLFEKYGFKTLYSYKYANFTQNGEVVFSPDAPHTHLNFMHIKL